MSKDTGIAWCDATFNPWWGCTKVSEACRDCYAEAFARRTGHAIWGDRTPDGDVVPRRLFGPKHWAEPLAWDRAADEAGVRRRVFCASMADVFEDRPDLDAPRERLFDLINRTPNLDWLLLSKRPENMHRMLPSWLLRHNVWLGTTVENQARAEERIPHLLKNAAAVHFLSCEPLLEGVDIGRWLLPQHEDELEFTAPHRLACVNGAWGPDPWVDGISWVIVGGESGGARRRTLDLGALSSIAAQCAAVGVPLFVKQDSGPRPGMQGRIPDALWARKHFPEVTL